MDTEGYDTASGAVAIPSSRRTAPMPIRSTPRAIPVTARSSGHNNSVGSSTDPIISGNNSPVLGSTPKKTWFASFFGSYKERQPPSGAPSSSFGTPGSGGFAVGSYPTPAPGALLYTDHSSSPFSPSSMSPSSSSSSSPIPYTVRSNRPMSDVGPLLRQALKEQQVVFTTANNTFHAKYDALDGTLLGLSLSLPLSLSRVPWLNACVCGAPLPLQRLVLCP